MSYSPGPMTEQPEICDELMSLEALLVGRVYLYTLFHKMFGGQPTAQLLELLGSRTTVDVVDEYAAADETMANLRDFLSHLPDKAGDQKHFEAILTEYRRYFQAPELPAFPWEAPFITREASIFGPSVLVLRDIYLAHGLQVKCFQSVPDDHISLMCAFMAHLARKSLMLFREGRVEELRRLMADQYRFAQEHMNTWFPEYAQHACMNMQGQACLYPQLAQGIAAFTRLDETFTAEVLVWVDEATPEIVAAMTDIPYDRAMLFDAVDETRECIESLQLVGLDENELVPSRRVIREEHDSAASELKMDGVI